MMKRIGGFPRDGFHLGLMLALTFSTGVIDAVGYLGLDRVFTANMTGNVVILGMALVGGTGLPVLGPLLALGGFMAGAVLGGRVLKSAAPGWTTRITIMLGIVTAMILSVAALLLSIEEDLTHPIAVTITTTLGAAMGLQAATARFIAVKDVTTVVITSTITALAADSAFGSGKGGGTARRTSAVVLMLAGAFAGGALLKWHLGGGLLLAGGITLAVTVLGTLHARQHVPSATVEARA